MFKNYINYSYVIYDGALIFRQLTGTALYYHSVTYCLSSISKVRLIFYNAKYYIFKYHFIFPDSYSLLSAQNSTHISYINFAEIRNLAMLFILLLFLKQTKVNGIVYVDARAI